MTSSLSPADLAGFIDHTLLKPEASREQILNLCSEADKYGFASVCVTPVWVSTAAAALKDSKSKTCTVIGFPLGATTTATKVFEATKAADDGADELDMVINIAAARAGDRSRLVEDIRAVAEVAHAKDKLLKVIIETCLLDHDAKVLACEASVEAGADFVKTSTGFNGPGATVEDVALMRATVGPDLGVKASGGVRSREDALAMIEAGATRIGASSGIAIVEGGTSSASY
ncbi:deoxyribose-phosphate aldolase [Galactobacter sp.]|uniref:deoxyribose-phosphate aldolase n=1 Tax=Galactobacter sp. TaxID=2676125 RepID=UPI0025BC0596|nr:deoxyribose-phosphate aldolase [Galactobacter sp.]